jgi:hypothetical protein
MPKNALKQSFDLTTRNAFTKVECEIGMTINGRELPSMEVLGKAFETGILAIQNAVTEAYKVVPERVEGSTL